MGKKKIDNSKWIPAIPIQNERISKYAGDKDVIIRDNGPTWGYMATFGKASVKMNCPFCDAEHRVYLWSMAGGGKRCENCHVLMYSRYTLAPKSELKLTSVLDIKHEI